MADGTAIGADQESPWDGWVDIYLDWHNTLGLGDGALYRKLRDEYAGFVVEVGCGDGRLFDEVNPDLGLDTSAKMLDRARQHRAGVPVGYGDITQLTLAEPASMVYAPMNVMSHLETNAAQDRALVSVRASVMPGGVFAFDALATNGDQIDKRKGNVQLRYRDETRIVYTAVTRRGSGLLMDWHCIVDELDSDGYVQRRRHLPAVTLLPRAPEDWAKAATQAGWAVLGHWGDYDCETPVSDTGWQILLLQNPI